MVAGLGLVSLTIIHPWGYHQNIIYTPIVYQAHDIRNRVARRSSFDLRVNSLNGDIKTSSYFLYLGRSSRLPHDFYVTRFYEGTRPYTLVVMLQVDAWDEIDGETVDGLLREVTSYFPAPVLVTLPRGNLVVADYDVWKAKIKRLQRNEPE